MKEVTGQVGVTKGATNAIPIDLTASCRERTCLVRVELAQGLAKPVYLALNRTWAWPGCRMQPLVHLAR